MSRPDPTKLEHVLAFIYLTFAHQTDGDLSKEERDTITIKVGEWMGDDATRGQINQAIDQAIEWYNSVADKRIETMAHGISLVAEHLSADAKKAVYADIQAIAEASGKVTKTEREWLELIKKDLGV